MLEMKETSYFFINWLIDRGGKINYSQIGCDFAVSTITTSLLKTRIKMLKCAGGPGPSKVPLFYDETPTYHDWSYPKVDVWTFYS